MKTFKSYILGFAALVGLTVGFSSCQDDIDAPTIDSPKATSVPNTTILELKERYWDDATNYAKVIGDSANAAERVVIRGRVISSDEEGNVFKSLVIQDETAALAFSVDRYNLYLNYRVGQEIVMDVTGMEIGKYAGLQQIGRKSWYENGSSWQVSFMSPEYFQAKVELNGVPEAELIDTLVVNSFSELSTAPEGLRKWQSQLVRFKNVSFTEGGKRKFSAYHSSSNDDQNTTITDRAGSTLTVRTSGYCTFWNETLPVGNIDLVGILSYYNTAWQIIMIDGNGVIKVGELPGTKEDPYTVEQAIEEQKAGLKTAGWVKGYIVGAVAPEVADVEKDEDIEWTAPTILNNTLVIAPSADCKDFAQCLVVVLPSGSAFQEYGNLRDNEANLGKEIMVNGTFGEVLGTYGVTGVTGKADSFVIEGVEVSDGSIAAGEGTKESPYNVAQVVAKNPTDKDNALESGVWVKGYIVGSMPTGGSSTTLSGTTFGTADAATTNLVLGPTPDCTDASLCVGVQLPAGIRSALALANKPENLGKVLAIKGDIMKYCGGPGVKNGSEYELTGAGSTDTPVTPDEPSSSVEPSGDGTEANPFNVAKALQTAKALSQDASQAAFVKGVIASITEISTSFGNATYMIKDAEGTETFQVYRGYYLNGDKFTSEDQLKVGAEVLISGELVNYMGNTPQLTTGSKLVSYKAPEGGETPDTPVTPDQPTTGGYTINASKLTPGGAVTVGAYTVDIQQASGYTAPMYHESTSAIRAYASNTITISGAKFSKVVFVLSSDAGFRYTTLTADKGAVGAQALGDTQTTWTGDAESVTFTVGEKATLGSDGAEKSGQFRFSSIIIYGEGGSNNETTQPSEPSEPSQPSEPDQPSEPAGDCVTVDALLFDTGDTDKGTPKASVEVGGYTISNSQGSGVSTPACKATWKALRLYANNTLTISSQSKIAKIEFTLSTSTLAKRYAEFTPSVGAITPAQAAGDETITWVGDASEITFTVGALAKFGSENTKPGQVHITNIKIYPAK